jgi:ectonucleoside triphosphate diphosphohydrolase 5/6
MSSFPSSWLNLLKILLALMVVAVFVLIVQVVPPFHGSNVRSLKATESLATLFGLHSPKYAVVIDAGSTGSRVLAFSFFKSNYDGSLRIKDELFYEIKPGLSSFADHPEKGGATIRELLDQADSFVPQGYRPLTPLILKATAGLRVLPPAKSERLLSEVRKLFQNSGYAVQSDAVDILDGSDEGIFSWFTINFLSGRLGQQIEGTAVTLDLGGGSTQITFALVGDVTDVPNQNLHIVRGATEPIQVFTNSYLGLGLMAARKSILQNHMAGAELAASPCIGSTSPQEWTFGGQKLFVKRSAATQSNPFDTCLDLASSLVKESVTVPRDLNAKTINAISYFYDRAVDANLIDPKDGGVIQVKDFEAAAEDVCKGPQEQHPFLCLDLTFITALLKHGYHLQPDVDIHLFKKIDGHETSWALGAAYRELLKS